MRITVPDDSLRAIETAVGILKKGGVVVIPTDTVYGLAASAFDRAAQKKIYRLKGRSYRKPLIIMPPDIPSGQNAAWRGYYPFPSARWKPGDSEAFTEALS